MHVACTLTIIPKMFILATISDNVYLFFLEVNEPIILRKDLNPKAHFKESNNGHYIILQIYNLYEYTIYLTRISELRCIYNNGL